MQLLILLGACSDEIHDGVRNVGLSFLVEAGRSCALEIKRLVMDDHQVKLALNCISNLSLTGLVHLMLAIVRVENRLEALL